MARRYALALDQDAAGEEATRRSLESAFDIFRREVMRVGNTAVPMGVRRELPKLRIITLPPGRDPDDVIRNDPDDWRNRIEQATPILDYLIQAEAVRPESSTAEGRLEVVNRIFPLITSLDNPFEQQEAFSKLASALKIEERTLEPPSVGARVAPRQQRRAPANYANTASDTSASNIGANALKEQRGDVVEEHLLALILTHDNEIYEAWKRLDLPELPDHFFWNPENREIWHLLRTADPVQRAEIMVSSDADRIRSAIPTTLDRRAQGKALSDLVRRLWERHSNVMNSKPLKPSPPSLRMMARPQTPSAP